MSLSPLWCEYAKWFLEFANSFKDEHNILHKKLLLKLKHSFRVVDEVSDLCSALHWDQIDIETAQITAILHDIGRFPQYQKYKTFRDQESEDHAESSCAILEEQGVLSDIDPVRRKQIMEAIRYHNKLTVPEFTEDIEPFVSVLRDADKLDILKLSYRDVRVLGPRDDWYGIDLGGHISPGIVYEFSTTHLVSYLSIQSLADLYVMELSWVYDFNYAESIDRALDRGYISDITNNLRRLDAASEELISLVCEYLGNKLGRGVVL